MPLLTTFHGRRKQCFVAALILAIQIFAAHRMATAQDCNDDPGDSATVYLSINPGCGSLRVGDTVVITCKGSTGQTWGRGAGVSVVYDPTLLAVVPSSVTKSPNSPFGLTPPPQYLADRIQVAILEASFIGPIYSGDLFTFEVTALAETPAASLTLDPPVTRWFPQGTGTLLYETAFEILGGRNFGDFDASGCTDINDCLFLLDNWMVDIDGMPIDLDDLLNLLDHYGSGPACV